jgi:hypothetical protein
MEGIHSTRGENLEDWDRVSLQWNLQCTGGAEEVLGSEG